MKGHGANYFSSIIENISDLIIIIDEKGEIKYSSPSCEKILGYDETEFSGKNVFTFIHPEDLDDALKKLDDLLATPEQSQRLALRIRHKDTTYRNIISTRKNLLNHPEIKGIILTGEDITDISQLQNSLQRTTKLLDEITAISLVGGWEYDVIKKKMFWTNETFNIHEFDPSLFSSEAEAAEYIEKSIQAYHPDDKARIMESFNRCVEEGVEYDIASRFITASGKKIWIRTIAKPVIEDGRTVKVIGTFADITKEKKREILLNARLELEEYSYIATLDDFLNKLLDEAENLTDSRIGFYHFVNDDQETLTLQTWSTNTLKNMCTAEGKGLHYSISKAGVWAESFITRKPVIHNDYVSLRNKKGLPPGHAPIIRELVIPVVRNNNVVAILGVGNKENNYDKEDLNIATQLAELSFSCVERLKSQNIILERERHLEALFENSPISIWEEDFSSVKKSFDDLKKQGVADLRKYLDENPSVLVDLASMVKVESINNASVKLLASESKNDVYKNLTKYFNTDSLEVFKEEMVAFWNGASNFQAEIPITRIDGKKIVLSLHVNVLPGHTNTLNKVMVSFIDITEAKYAERTLKEAADLTSKKNSELEDKNQELRRAREATLNIIEDLSVEIEERKRSELALKQSEANNRAITETANDSIITTDTSGKILSWNNASQTIFGFENSEMMGNAFDKILFERHDGKNIKVFRKMVEAANKEGVGNTINLTGKRKNGNEFPAELSMSKWESEEKTYFTVIIRDVTERVNAENELIKQKKLAESIVDNIPIMIAYFNEKGEFEFVNKQWEKVLGWSLDEIKKTPDIMKEFYPDEKLRNNVIEFMMKAEPYWLDMVTRIKDGTFINTSWINVKLPDGRSIGIGQDITQRKISEENLKKLNFGLQLAIEGGDLGTFDADIANGKVEVNERYLSMIGYSRDEIQMTNDFWKSIVHPDDQSKVLEMSKKIESGELEWMEAHYRARHKSGKWIWILDRAKGFNYNSEGKPTRAAGTHRDITESKIAEEELNRFFDLVPVMVCVASNGKFDKINNAWESVLGYSKEEMIGTAFTDYIHPEDIEPTLKEVQTQIGGGLTINFINRYRAKNGEYKLLEWVAGPSPDGVKLYAAARDITEKAKSDLELKKYREHLEELVEHRTEEIDSINRTLLQEIELKKEAEQKLKSALETEKELNKFKSNFISTASHQFRTPLTSILMSTGMLQKYSGAWDKEKIDEYFERIKRSINNLRGLMDDVISINRSEMGKNIFNPSRTNLKECCEKIIEEVKIFLIDKQEILFEYKPKKLFYNIDGKQIELMLHNLLFNALKYSPDGGKIVLHIEEVKGNLVLTISDRGIGVPEEDLPYLFEPFHRGSNAEDIEGTGLGLSIVKHAVELHRGKISVDSVIGEGTIFKIDLPLIPE